MSRIGLKPITIPDGVKTFVREGNVKVEGPNGKLEQETPAEISVEIDEGSKQIVVKRPSDAKKHRALHGLTRALVANMIEGVSKGFERQLEIIGTGYNAKLQGRELVLNIGFCHPVLLKIPQGVEVDVPAATQVVVKGADKQQVGQFAANIRGVRPPEPYKGKGIKYRGEQIRRKAGKKTGE